MKSVEHLLVALHEREKIPAPRRRAKVRARLLAMRADKTIAIFETPLGWLGVAFSARGIATVHLPRGSRVHALRDLRTAYPDAILDAAPPANIARELREYAQGRRREFNLPLDWSAIKPFQRAVLQAAHTIPFGETRSYGWIAHAIGKPRASRAVGQALGANPIPIIVPCHRVVASDGGLGGYAGGLTLKKKLLQLEGATISL